ncbi:MAG: hypothetical protein NTAFB09_23210 [Nitrosospira sp.]
MDRQGKNKAQKAALWIRFVSGIVTGIVWRVDDQDGSLTIKTTINFFDSRSFIGIAANFFTAAMHRQESAYKYGRGGKENSYNGRR